MSKRLKITLGIVGGLVVMFTVLWMWPFGRFILTGGLGDLEERTYNKQEWLTAKESGTLVDLRTRMLMMDDLLNNHLKKGIDSVAVKDILGEPERQYGFSYAIGTLVEGMEPMFLIVAFDTTGHSTAYQIKTEGTLQGKEDPSVQIRVGDN